VLKKEKKKHPLAGYNRGKLQSIIDFFLFKRCL